MGEPNTKKLTQPVMDAGSRTQRRIGMQTV